MPSETVFLLDSGPEATLVELPALTALTTTSPAGLTWGYVHGPDLAPDAPAAERTRWSDVVLIERLRRAIARINRELPPAAVQRAVEVVMTSTSPAVIEDHRGFHDLLLAGVPVAYRDAAGVERNAHAQLID
jgi:type I restriction enzyme R subunit